MCVGRSGKPATVSSVSRRENPESLLQHDSERVRCDPPLPALLFCRLFQFFFPSFFLFFLSNFYPNSHPLLQVGAVNFLGAGIKPTEGTFLIIRNTRPGVRMKFLPGELLN